MTQASDPLFYLADSAIQAKKAPLRKNRYKRTFMKKMNATVAKPPKNRIFRSRNVFCRLKILALQAFKALVLANFNTIFLEILEAGTRQQLAVYDVLRE